METSAPKPRLGPQGLPDDGICNHHRRGGALHRSFVHDHIGWKRPDPVGHGGKGPGNHPGPTARGKCSSREHFWVGDSISGNPETDGSPDVGIPPELGGSNGFGATPGVPPAASGTSSSSSGSGSGNPTSGSNSSASSSQAESGEEGWLSGLWNKTKDYMASGQILKDAAHIGKETLDFLILDDVSGCFTGKDTDGNQLAGWERGLSCVSLVPAAKWAKFGKYADEVFAFASKLDDKLASTRLGEGMRTAKRKLEDLFGRGKQVACGCNSRNHFLENVRHPSQNTDEAYEAYFETILGKRLRRVKATDLASPNSPVNIPGEVLGQWIKDGRVKRGIPRKLDNYIKNYKPQKIQLDKDLIVTIDKDAMKYILEGHHPKHFNPKARIKHNGNVKEKNTLFPKNMTEKDVEQLLIKIVQQERDVISKWPSTRGFQLGKKVKGKGKDIIVDGIKYVIGFQEEVISNGMRYRRVGQFYPIVDLPDK
ncbi:pre-toxin TG domain-containing protein [Planifilum fulgidum]|uniref:pre-toxin TG domain-containing protein n=1 Tax=Planifilum fulgidum TaxID=201973 RepID=UPI0015A534A6|nr:pre-toxin TG domain-containing protein [Planifilum fulgidum]